MAATALSRAAADAFMATSRCAAPDGSPGARSSSRTSSDSAPSRSPRPASSEASDDMAARAAKALPDDASSLHDLSKPASSPCAANISLSAETASDAAWWVFAPDAAEETYASAAERRSTVLGANPAAAARTLLNSPAPAAPATAAATAAHTAMHFFTSTSFPRLPARRA